MTRTRSILVLGGVLALGVGGTIGVAVAADRPTDDTIRPVVQQGTSTATATPTATNTQEPGDDDVVDQAPMATATSPGNVPSVEDSPPHHPSNSAEPGDDNGGDRVRGGDHEDDSRHGGEGEDGRHGDDDSDTDDHGGHGDD